MSIKYKVSSIKKLFYLLLSIMKISTVFANNEMIPVLYTCDGWGYFPQLIIEDLPLCTKCLVLIVDDPDAYKGTRDHILLVNIPLSGDDPMVISQDHFDQWTFGQNSRWEQARWAPCAPSGTHRYIFKLYALSEMLDISAWFSKERLLELMWGKILDHVELVGLNKRK